MRKIVWQIIKNVLLLALILFLCLSLFSTNWAIKTFHFFNFDEVLFQLTTPIKSASSSILTSYVKESLIGAVLLTGIIFGFLCVILHYINCNSFNIKLEFWKKKFDFNITGRVIKRCIRVFGLILTIGIVYYCLDKMLFIDYVKAQANDSSFIEEHYVDPDDVTITFPEEKRNLIYIYLESYESTFFSSDLGGGGSYNYIEPLNELTSTNISFSDTELFGGATMVTGTSWTSASMVSQTAGIPLKNRLDNVSGVNSMLSGATSLGNILEENGYQQMLMIGSDKDFGNRGAYFSSHGNYQIYDYYTAIEKKKISEDYYVWWGFEDSKLFEFAKEEITNMASIGQPFNFTMLTANTHSVDGYLEPGCPLMFSSAYANSIYCSSMQVASFVDWIQQQDFYPNTTIILVGDHVSMQEDFYPDETTRRSYNLFINSAITDGDFTNRSFTVMDFFPTTLTSLGATIEGDRLGLGTDLFSDTPTLMEEVGYEYFEEEIQKYSPYYMKEFYYS